mgnify:CR=1 FL=1
MKFEVKTKQLRDAIGVVSKAVSKESKTDALRGILLHATEKGLQLTGYNGEFAFCHVIPSEIEGEIYVDNITPGKIILPQVYLQQIISKLRGDTVKIETKPNFQAIISSESIGGSKKKAVPSIHDLAGLDPESYPILPKIGKEDSFKVPCDVLKLAMKETLIAVATEAIHRPILTGVHFKLESNLLDVIATDAHRLASRKVIINQEVEPFDMVVPGSSLKELVKVLPDTNSEADIYFNKNYMVVTFDRTTFMTRLLEGTFPDTSRVIPQNFCTTIKVNVDEMLYAVNSCNIFKENGKTVIKLMTSHEEELIKLVAFEKQIGKAEETLIYEEGEGDPITINFNAKYMKEALEAVSGENKVIISFSGSNLPFIIKPENRDDITHVILPIRMGS